MSQNNGDTLEILLDYTINGIALEEYEADEIEFSIGSLKFLLSNGDILTDEDSGKYYVSLSQEQSFTLNYITSYQLRIKKDNKVVSTDITKLSIGASISKNVI